MQTRLAAFGAILVSLVILLSCAPATVPTPTPSKAALRATPTEATRPAEKAATPTAVPTPTPPPPRPSPTAVASSQPTPTSVPASPSPPPTVAKAPAPATPARVAVIENSGRKDYLNSRGERFVFKTYEEARSSGFRLHDFALVYFYSGSIPGRDTLNTMANEVKDFIANGGVFFITYEGFYGWETQSFTTSWLPWDIRTYYSSGKTVSLIADTSHPLFVGFKNRELAAWSNGAGVFGSMGPQWKVLVQPDQAPSEISNARPLAQIVEAEFGKGLVLMSTVHNPWNTDFNSTLLEDNTLKYLKSRAGLP